MKGIARIIASHRKDKGLSQPQLAELLAQSSNLRITNKAVSSWEHALTEPNATVFMHLCKVLEVPDCVEEFFGNNPSDPLAVLNDDGKKVAKDYISLLAKVDKYAKDPRELRTAEPAVPITGKEKSNTKKSQIIQFDEYKKQLSEEEPEEEKTIPLFAARPSAGTGEYIDSDSYSLIPVSEKVWRNADFAVTIHGDSMEPEFHDHQTVYVRSQPSLENGEIGIFYLEGMTYIKKYQNDDGGVFLISLNKKYDPIKVTEDDISNDSFRIFGKVCLF